MPFRILVVDDENAIREAIRMTLEYEGYRIDEARSALRDGIEQARRQGNAHAAGEMSEFLASLGDLG